MTKVFFVDHTENLDNFHLKQGSIVKHSHSTVFVIRWIFFHRTSYRSSVEYGCFFLLTFVQNVLWKLRKRLHTFVLYNHMYFGAGWDTKLMKRFLTCFVLASVFAPFLFGQSKKPTLMILPSDNWCEQRYFMTKFLDQGRTISIPDYQAAFREDSELGAIVAQLGQVLTTCGYSLKDTEQELKKLAKESAEDAVTYSKAGSSLAENPLDVLKRTSKADFIIQIGWQVNKEKKGLSISFTLEAFDSYTSKRIATASGISKPSSEIVPRILAKAVNDNIKPFSKQLDAYFADAEMNGREILLTVRRWEDWEYDLETEYGGEELLDVIQNWLTKNTVGGCFNLSDATENFARFEQVRIPLANEKGVAIDARAFTSELRKYLRMTPYSIPTKVITKGLGEAQIILGDQ